MTAVPESSSPGRAIAFWLCGALGVPVTALGWLWMWGVSEEATRGAASGATQGASITFMVAPLVVVHVIGIVVLASVARGWRSGRVRRVALTVVVASALGLAIALSVTGGQLVVPGQLPFSP
ncbi:hypothetical protein [Curtobacterium sp. VKM Ac-2922]|uniref:hypothetical protein n=1 Tax=Curtobacterium sp. VKM Ac-2922 TaxID=2929475 RepID=UPI001FB39405|nr:hypothetical protein [Curtobacterium sp. VKM Ac-2922]MCJ1714955.1 hypothetical protein [Curtobacterium sp. VKM Ac-2922]